MTQLIAIEEVLVHAPAGKVWEVLTRPAFIRQWDDVPEAFTGDALELGSEFVWESGDGATHMKVVTFEPNKRLRQQWSHSAVSSAGDDIAYSFDLNEQAGQTVLTITIGDWGVLPEGESYYEASVAFAKEASQAIKELAEAWRGDS